MLEVSIVECFIESRLCRTSLTYQQFYVEQHLELIDMIYQ